MDPARRDRRLLIVAAIVAVAAPWLAANHLQSRVDDQLVPAMEDRLGATVALGSVEVSLSGAVRLREVAIGRILSADAIEGSISLRSLLAGDLRADEVRVVRPRLRVRARRTEAGVESDLQDLIRRAARRRGERTHSGPSAKPRRIVVTGGALEVDINGGGMVRADGVELRPQQSGVRLIAGETRVELARSGVTTTARFERAAADLRMPALSVSRLLAVAGAVRLTPDGGAPASLNEVSLGYRLAPSEALRFDARIDRPGRDPRISARSTAANPRAIVIDANDAPLSPLGPFAPPSIDLDAAQASGRATLHWRPDQVTLDGTVDIAGAAIDDPRIARLRVPVDAQLRGRAALAGNRFSIEGGSVTRNGVAVSVEALLARDASGAPQSGALTINLPRSSCPNALSALPPPMRAELAGMRTEGTVAARVAITFDRSREDATKLETNIDVSRCRVLAEPSGADARSLRQAFQHTYPDGSRGRIDPADPGYVSLRYLPEHLVGAFVSAEDARFFQHNGFDRSQIERSLGINVQAGGFVRGGSTISQQLVKNVFLSPRRTLTRKLQEAVLTWRLERHLSKRLIMERYLNIIELGEGVFGVEAAARYWFGKSARRLGIAESAFLAALTPAPKTITRRVRANGGLDSATRARFETVLRAMRRNRIITRDTAKRAMRQPLRLRTPKLARRP